MPQAQHQRAAEPVPATTCVCKRCDRELPHTEEYFHLATPWKHMGDVRYLRRVCKRCCHTMNNERRRKAVATQQAVKRAAGPAKWTPRVVGESGPEGGYTEHPDDGYRFVCLPDSHGRLIDWEAAEAALAFVRYYRPVRIFLLGDHVDFDAFSRFEGASERIQQLPEDLGHWKRFGGLIREAAPDAKIEYRKGNHEFRLQRWLWKHPEMAAVLKWQGVDLPNILGLADLRIEWVESGTTMVNDRLLVKHGHLVRQRSGYTGTGELERNGISGISGHTHRLGQIYKRSRVGLLTWVESGCLCQYDPDYMEGQVSDWQHGLSFGTVSLRGHGFSVHTAPIIGGRVKALGTDIGP